MNNKLRIDHVDWHRNGISGEGFYAVEFRDPEAGTPGRMKAIVFPERYHVAVLCLDAGNERSHWRGDWYERPLRRAIRRWEAKEDRKMKAQLRALGSKLRA